jgi:hypothetical protein
MSGTKILKALVIDTAKSQSAGSEYEWNKLQQSETFIRDIKTPDVNVESSEEQNRLISGIPTPFARAEMFKYALRSNDDVGRTQGLLAFYAGLRAEWKGLVSCLALDNQPITIERIPLAYSDGKPIGQTRNLYEPKGALGNMLMQDRDLWCDPAELGDRNREAVPFIYVIKYDRQLVGGTSPEGLLFTAPVYQVSSTRAFVDQRTRRFTDPLSGSLSSEETERLHAYVQHLSRNWSLYVDQFGGRKPDITRIGSFLSEWRSEIQAYASRRGFNLDENAIVPNLDKFGSPFAALFNFRTTLYGFNGIISSERGSFNPPEGVEPVEVELSDLLLDPALGAPAEIAFDTPEESERLGVHLLTVTEPRLRHFTLPLSERGLEIFQDSIGDILRVGGDFKSHLRGSYDPETRTLHVTFEVDVAGNVTSIERSYKDLARIDGQRVLCWPDFVSRIWRKYYLYSELPHTAPEIRAFPLRADRDNFRLRFESADGRRHLKKIAQDGKLIDRDDSASLVLEHDVNKVGSTDLKYEIYESDDPFKGVELSWRNRQLGYVLFRNLSEQSPFGLKDFRHSHYSLQPVRVGFDFGSNNICVSYKEENGPSAALLDFQNRRRYLLGSDGADDERLAATPNKVFFFQNQRTPSNKVKSMVMVHDEKRVRGVSPGADAIVEVEKAVKGGFPVFEKNVPVEAGTDTALTVKFLNVAHQIKYNMKWSYDKKENAHKKGFLRTLWLKTYAELLEAERFPEKLVWAFPSAMNTQIRQEYSRLWDGVCELTPLGDAFKRARVARLDSESSGSSSAPRRLGQAARAPDPDRLSPQTESLSVCKFALDQGYDVSGRSVFIGFDVGGSTTDILCMVQRKVIDARTGHESHPPTLVKEGSIRLAAGRIADATKRSPKFLEVLKTFCRKRDLHVHGVNVPPIRLNAGTAGYYYNQVVDRLDDEYELNELYRDIASDCQELFALNAYITGLVIYYAGQLAARVRSEQEKNPADYIMPFEDVALGRFGKGGRMFDWLYAMNEGAAEDYYNQCFAAGYGDRAYDDIKAFTFQRSETQFVKAEVSFGLASTREVATATDTISEIIGEEGFTFNGAPVLAEHAAEPRFLKGIGSQFAVPRDFKRFTEFAKLFQGFSQEFLGIKLPNIEDDIRSMRLTPYVQNLPEFQLAAKQGADFDYEAPLIILEGMCFLDTILDKKLFK